MKKITLIVNVKLPQFTKVSVFVLALSTQWNIPRRNIYLLMSECWASVEQ